MSVILLALLIVGTILAAIAVLRSRGDDLTAWAAFTIGLALAAERL